MLHYKPNPTQVRSLNREEFLKTKENNLENVREMNKKAKIRKRFLSSQLHTTDHELLLPATKKQNFTVADGTDEMNMANVFNVIALLCAALNKFCTKCDDNKYCTPSAQKSN